MTRLTPVETEHIECQKILKEIWKKELDRDPSELSFIWKENFVTVSRESKSIDIHKSSCNGYSKAGIDYFKKQYLEEIKTKLQVLL